MEGRFRQVLVASTGLTYVLILLGLYTGATGGGLSCGAQWPLCNGFLGLFPANWASFFEWTHRFVAMVVGLLLLGTLYGAWRWQSDRRVRFGVTAALVLLPFQVVLGAVTTTAGGLFPGGFDPLVMLAHFSLAATIFALLIAATVTVLGSPGEESLPGLLGGMAILLVVHTAFDVTGVLAFTPRNQAVYYGASYALLAGFVAVAVWWRQGVLDVHVVGGGLAVLGGLSVVADMVLSRRLLGLDPVLSWVATLGVLVGLVGVAWAVSRRPGRDRSVPATE